MDMALAHRDTGGSWIEGLYLKQMNLVFNYICIDSTTSKEENAFQTWDPFTYGLILIQVWISNHMLSKVWDAITYPIPNFKFENG